VSGSLEVRKAGTGAPIAVLTEKQVVGEMALLDDEPRSASVVAVSEVHLLSLQRRDLERILRRYSSIAFTMMRMLSRRLRERMSA
jgi:CRP-like cAMP-binding protein